MRTYQRRWSAIVLLAGILFTATVLEAQEKKMILGVGANHQLYSRKTVDSSWEHIPRSGDVISVAVMKDGTILGVGTNHQLYIWTQTKLSSTWELISKSGDVISVAVMKDGTILGVGTNHQLYTRKTVGSSWEHIPRSGDVISVAVMKDGTILGVGTNHQLYIWTQTKLSSTWELISKSGDVISVAVMKDGTILGVGTNHQLYTRKTVGSSWEHIPCSGDVISVAVLDAQTLITEEEARKRKDIGESLAALYSAKTPFQADEITPENVKGKIFVLRNLENNFFDSYERNIKEPHPEKWSAEQFVLFFVGTDRGKNRHYFAIARYADGWIVGVPGAESESQIKNKVVQMDKKFSKDWTQDDQVFYFEPAPKGEHSWLIKTWEADLCWDGGGGRDDVSTEIPNDGANQAWQLYEVGEFYVPSTQPATRNMVVPITPSWQKAEAPNPNTDSELYQYQSVGSTVIPYFLIEDPDEWQALDQGAYYKLERQQRWIHKERKLNPGTRDIDYELSTTHGWSQATSKSFATSVGLVISTTVGLSTTVGGGGGIPLVAEGSVEVTASLEMSMSVSSELSWEWTNTNTVFGEKSVTTTYHIPPNKVAHFWQVQENFVLYKIDVEGQEKLENSWEILTEEVVHTEVDL